MLILTQAHLDAVCRHAQDTYPRECCGILLGRLSEKRWEVAEVRPAHNLAPPGVQDRYLLDPKDRYLAETSARQKSLAVVGFYHSHPDHDVYFSQTDLQNSEEFLMGEPWLPPVYAYLVVSIRDSQPQGHGAFLVDQGRAVLLEVSIL